VLLLSVAYRELSVDWCWWASKEGQSAKHFYCTNQWNSSAKLAIPIEAVPVTMEDDFHKVGELP
jgi:hypothetical protein